MTAMARRLLKEWRAAHPDAALRLLGVGVADLRTPGQADLFYGSGPRDSRLDASHRWHPRSVRQRPFDAGKLAAAAAAAVAGWVGRSARAGG